MSSLSTPGLVKSFDQGPPSLAKQLLAQQYNVLLSLSLLLAAALNASLADIARFIMPAEFYNEFLHYGSCIIFYYFILFNLQTTSSIFLQLKRRAFSILAVEIFILTLSLLVAGVLTYFEFSLFQVVFGVSFVILGGVLVSFILDRPSSYMAIGLPVLISIAASGLLSVLSLLLRRQDGFPLLFVLSLSIIAPFGLYILEYMRRSPRKELA